MPSTSRDALPYPALTDSPHVPRDLQALAEAVEARLHRVWVCTSATRPTGVPAGFHIYETDTGADMLYTGADWVPLGAGGGGGSGAGRHAQFTGAAQSVGSGSNVVCAWPTTDVPSPAVNRGSRGAGHQFTLTEAGIWAITTTVRWASSSSTGERYVGIRDGADATLAGQGPGASGAGPVTCNVSVQRYFSAGSIVYVTLWQGTGGTRQLEPGTDGGWVRLNLAKVA